MQNDTIGKRLHRLRREKNLSQQQLAEAVGVSRQTVCKWESDGAMPSADNIGFLSEALEVSPDYFISAVGLARSKEAANANAVAEDGPIVSSTECAACVGKKKHLVYKILIIVTAIVFCVFLMLAVATGCISLSTNTGDRVISTVSVDRSVFVAMAVCSGILFAALVAEICVYTVKSR